MSANAKTKPLSYTDCRSALRVLGRMTGLPNVPAATHKMIGTLTESIEANKGTWFKTAPAAKAAKTATARARGTAAA